MRGVRPRIGYIRVRVRPRIGHLVPRRLGVRYGCKGKD